ncbi:hypothetical protein BEN47_11585 [Hymenobacter lapidarius]|uniref:Polysaccharide biosynthesis protein n=1 Tax=Hymenobacter lapidarius TaxID=1908237 RepID=A0A1G1T8A9_9BACT|nr:hypothetical protein BEN47_11585 [Hymenobacter lapidarius]
MVHISLILTIGSVIAIGIALKVAAPALSAFLNIEGLGRWMYAVPLMLLLFNLNAIMFTWYTRDKAFAKRAGVDVSTALTSKIFTIGYGLLSGGAVGGLLFGEFFNRTVTMLALFFGGIKKNVRELWTSFNWQEIKQMALEYKNFPLYVLPANYLNTISSQLPIFALTTGFGTTAVGLYSFSVSLMEIPINLIGNAIGPVFAQKAVEVHYNEPARLPVITLDLYNKLIYLGVIPFGFITIFGDWIFKFAFGARWEGAGLFTAFLGYYYILKLTSLSTSGIYAVLNKQRYLLISNTSTLLARGLGLGIGLYFKDVKIAMLLFGAGSFLSAFGTDLHILYLLRLPIARIALRTILILSVMLAIFYSLRLALVRVGFDSYL